MPSPFPGMNPYIEQDAYWQDFHLEFLPVEQRLPLIDHYLAHCRQMLKTKQSDQSDEMPRFLYVFSDRTAACWDTSEAKALHPPEGLNSVSGSGA